MAKEVYYHWLFRLSGPQVYNPRHLTQSEAPDTIRGTAWHLTLTLAAS